MSYRDTPRYTVYSFSSLLLLLNVMISPYAACNPGEAAVLGFKQFFTFLLADLYSLDPSQ